MKVIVTSEGNNFRRELLKSIGTARNSEDNTQNLPPISMKNSPKEQKIQPQEQLDPNLAQIKVKAPHVMISKEFKQKYINLSQKLTIPKEFESSQKNKKSNDDFIDYKHQKILENQSNLVKQRELIFQNIKKKAAKMEKEQLENADKLKEKIANDTEDTNNFLQSLHPKRMPQAIVQKHKNYYANVWKKFGVEELSQPKN